VDRDVHFGKATLGQPGGVGGCLVDPVDQVGLALRGRRRARGLGYRTSEMPAGGRHRITAPDREDDPAAGAGQPDQPFGAGRHVGEEEDAERGLDHVVAAGIPRGHIGLVSTQLRQVGRRPPQLIDHRTRQVDGVDHPVRTDQARCGNRRSPGAAAGIQDAFTGTKAGRRHGRRTDGPPQVAPERGEVGCGGVEGAPGSFLRDSYHSTMVIVVNSVTRVPPRSYSAHGW
jgi:hypothetical protein